MTKIPARRPPVRPARRALAPLRAQVLDELREAIISGRLAPRTRLIERELIGMLGVSRTVVREALRQLQSEGLVAEDAKKGMAVRELTAVEAAHLYAIRALLEGLAARLFVENADAAHVHKLVERSSAPSKRTRSEIPDASCARRTASTKVFSREPEARRFRRCWKCSMRASHAGARWAWDTRIAPHGGPVKASAACAHCSRRSNGETRRGPSSSCARNAQTRPRKWRAFSRKNSE